MSIKLFVVHGSHPCTTVRRALEIKGLPYSVVELPPPFHAPIQRVLFGARTVPGVKLADGTKVSGSRAILQRLEELAPEPALLPADAGARRRVLDAEAWGDEVLQPIARRLLWSAFARAPRAMKGYQEGSKLPPMPMPVLLALAPAVTRAERRLNGADDGTARADLRALPGHLDRVDAWIADGTLGGPTPNRADLQIAPTVRLLMTIGDVATLIEDRPAAEHARRIVPESHGHVPAGTLPADWLPAPAGAAA